MASKRKTNRRQFLKGKTAIDALTDMRTSAVWPEGNEPCDNGAPSRRDEERDYLVQVGRRAMACEFQVLLNAGQHAGAVDAAMESLELVNAIEEQLSVFRPHSELSEINRCAAEHTCHVEHQLFELLMRCAQWYQLTQGAFDITAGPLVRLWGFHTRRGQFPTDEQVLEVLGRVGTQHLDLDAPRQMIRFRRPGMALNLGSVGKGYALDRCAGVLKEADVQDYMIHGGHSSILARGSRIKDSEKPEWSVALRHPLRPERRLAEIRLWNQALGTSGSGQQFFYHRGRRYGHVLDPRTGSPSEGVLSATVLAPDAAEADALATAFFVMGADAAREYCSNRPELSAVLVRPGTRQGTVALETIALDDQLLILGP